jgi:putative ABC transport system permease protein
MSDLKAAFRSLRASPTFTAVALLVLALGIGASTAVFSVVDAIVLRGLPFDEHDRLVAVGQRNLPMGQLAPGAQPGADPFSLSTAAPQNYRDWADQQQVFESIAAIAGGALTMREANAEPEEIRAQRVTADFFTVLRERPAIGSTFTAANEVDGQHRVAILSDGLWRRRFGADPGIVGRLIPIEGGQFQILGVMGPEFEYPVGAPRPTEMWVPYVVPAEERVRNPNSFSYYLSTIARLKPGVSLDQAQAEMHRIALALQQANPAWNKDTFVGVRPLRDHIVGAQTHRWMLLLLGAVGLVLLIACVNVANLLLARATTRQREVGIRAAMGASRWRLVRQLLVESLVLAGLGTVLGVVLAWWGVNVLRTAIPDGVPRVASIALDARVLGAAMLVSVVTGMLFGSVPAVQLSRPDLTRALKENARGTSAGRWQRYLRNALVSVEVAIAVILLVGAALFIGSFRTLMKIDPGFDPSNVLTTSLQPRWDRSVAGAPIPDYRAEVGRIVDRIAALPGVVHAAAISGGMPMGGSMSQSSITVAGREIPPADRSISVRQVTPDYHRAVGIPLKRGRLLEPGDRDGLTPVIVINELAAAKYFPDSDPIGQTVQINGPRTIVGIVGDVYQTRLETAPRTEAYMPVAQNRVIFTELVVKTSAPPESLAAGVRAAVLAEMPDVPLRNTRTLEEVIARQVAQRRFNMLLLGLFGVLGLVIAAVGIYGVLAYVVSQREREIGVRMALGASRGRVVGGVVSTAGLLVAAGLAAGLTASYFLVGQAQSFLFRMRVDDWRVFASALAALVVAALLAAVIPARRAAGVDPMIALRAE